VNDRKIGGQKNVRKVWERNVDEGGERDAHETLLQIANCKFSISNSHFAICNLPRRLPFCPPLCRFSFSHLPSFSLLFHFSAPYFSVEL
jgi:hypothetical protein